jgi:transcriptional regulator with XRE-family HTH domain
MQRTPPSQLRQVLAANVRRRRELLGLSQERLAGEADLDRTYVSQIERGVRNVSLDCLDKLARGLSAEAWALLRPAGPADELKS